MDHLREGISLRAYGHQDPLVAYKSESFALFSQMQEEMRRQLISLLFSVETASPEAGPRPIAPQAVMAPVSFQHGEFSAFKQPRPEAAVSSLTPAQAGPAPAAHLEPVHAGPRVGRNDPCPCGSGKKYKRCCGLKTG
jgi:preprotein translocase subunit SecA